MTRFDTLLVEYQYRGGLRREFDVLNQATASKGETAARKRVMTDLAFNRDLPTKIKVIYGCGIPHKVLTIKEILPKRLWKRAGLE
jgi:hypothetical protein